MKVILGQRDSCCTSHYEREERRREEEAEVRRGRIIISSPQTCNFVCSADEGDCCPLRGQECQFP